MKNKKYNIVAGFIRGGTSCLMSALRECGLPVFGFKYPMKYTMEFVNELNQK